MDEIQRKDNKEISKYLKIICGKTMQALLDSYMFMFPAAYKYDNKDTFMFRYSYYAFRQKAILSVKKLIEPAKTDKITLQYLVQLLTQSDISILSEQGKVALKADYDTLFSSEHALRIKKFRDAFCHNLSNSNEAMCYHKDIMYVINGSLHILEQLYTITELSLPTFFTEARNIAEYLASNYWKALDIAAKNSNNNHDINAKLQKLLDGEF